MKLSMWILADWLQKYNPVVKIQDGMPILRGVRMLSAQTNANHSYMLLGYAKDFFYSFSTDLICVNGHDMLILKADDIDEVFNDILAAFDFYNDWEEHLLQLINQDCSLQMLLDASIPIFNNSLSVSDSSYMNTVYSFVNQKDSIAQYVEQNKRLPEELILATYETANQRRMETTSYLMHLPMVDLDAGCCNLFMNRNHVGWVSLISNRHPITQSQLQLLDVCGEQIAQWLLRGEHSQYFVGKTLLFQHLLQNQPVDSISLSQTLISLGWKKEDSKTLYRIQYEHDDALPAPLINIVQKYLKNCIPVPFQNSMILLTNNRILSSDETDIILGKILNRFHAFCGKSYPFTDFYKLPASLGQASTALEYGNPSTGSIHFCGDYGLYCLQDTLKKNASVQIIHPVLEQCKCYDSLHHTKLYHTLYVYLLQERNQYKSAEILGIHRNTLLYRIQKICDLTNVDLENPEVRVYLMLSFLIDAAQQSL